jgi:MFS family permease
MFQAQSISSPENRNGLFFRAIYASSFFFAFHSALLTYVESSFLGTFLSNTLIGVIFALSSIVAILGLVLMPTLLNKYGNYRILLFLLIIEIITLTILADLNSPIKLIIPIFIIHLAIYPLVFFSMDIFLESRSPNIITGKIRGIYLTIQNVAWIAPPLIAGLILSSGDYWKIFASAVTVLFPTFLIALWKFREFHDPPYTRIPFLSTIKEVWRRRDLYRIFMSSLLLSFFFSWMVIYTPLYLNKHMGMAWGDIGIIFTIMLLPFVLFSFPSGSLSDTRFGGKEMLSLGFVIMAISTGILTFVTSQSIIIWATLLFITRVGATLVQTMNESYFFKQINVSDVAIISVFRYAQPLGYLLGPIAASALLYFVDFRFIFLVLGIIMLYGLRYSLTLKDTM